jgi:DNA-binding CsgD family transcriptional regulator
MKFSNPARLTAAIDVLPQLYAPCELDDFPMQMLHVLKRAVPSDVNAYNEVNPRLRRAVGIIDDPQFPMEKLVGPLETYMHEHPVIRHCQQTRDGSARKISDFMSQAELHRTGLYNELYKLCSVDYQMSMTIRASDQQIVALVANRGKTDFTEDDRTVMNFLRPHVAQAYQSAIALTRLKTQLRRANEALANVDQGIITVNRLRIEFASARAMESLVTFFGSRPRNGQLPEALHAWLQKSLTRAEFGKSPPRAHEPIRIFGERGWLVVRLLGNAVDGNTTLLLEEQASAGTASEKLRPLGLTPREAEALYWVAQGKTNPEIAIICGLSARTVQKHLEHIFQKLGVETRTAAALRASELL